MHKMFPNYEFDEEGRIVPGEGAKLINFKELKELLLSKDLSREEELFWYTNGDAKFLDCEDNLNGSKVALQSFPRSGNTFLRQCLMQITGVVEGADMSASCTL